MPSAAGAFVGRVRTELDAAVCFWIACASALLLSGQGIFNGLGDCTTIRGPDRSKEDLFVGHALDALTAPV